MAFAQISIGRNMIFLSESSLFSIEMYKNAKLALCLLSEHMSFIRTDSNGATKNYSQECQREIGTDRGVSFDLHGIGES